MAAAISSVTFLGANCWPTTSTCWELATMPMGARSLAVLNGILGNSEGLIASDTVCKPMV
ncbi:hypothetical protein D3C78_1998730 [compost metagenome]